MARPKRWKYKGVENGMDTITFQSWKYFFAYIHDEMLDFPHYVWRGQADSSWKLEPTLDRELKKINSLDNKSVNKHLEGFKYSIRGRRGQNPSSIELENDWWALGQHYGLATPLLDWSYSPFVAAFFAFEDEKVDSEYRAIYSLNVSSVVVQTSKKSKKDNSFKNIVESVKPLSDENNRLVSQNGEFTRAPLGIDLESLIEKEYYDVSDAYILMKFLVPSKDREFCLRYLNKMNINHLTLFPDMTGSSKYCNMKLKTDKY